MKDRYFLAGGLLLLLGLLAGCAGEKAYSGNVCGSDYRCMQEQVFQYRQQADALNLMADRYAREANMKAQELGKDSEEARKSQEMAKKYALQADEADKLAREYRRQIPHNAY